MRTRKNVNIERQSRIEPGAVTLEMHVLAARHGWVYAEHLCQADSRGPGRDPHWLTLIVRVLVPHGFASIFKPTPCLRANSVTAAPQLLDFSRHGVSEKTLDEEIGWGTTGLRNSGHWIRNWNHWIRNWNHWIKKLKPLD